MAPSNSRKRRTAVDDESDSDDTPRQAPNRRRRANSDDEASDDADETTIAVVGEGATSQDQVVKKLVRYALACEYSRNTIKRDAIREKVFNRQKQPFNKIFQAAQEELRNVFGMVMTELPGRDKSSLKERLAQRETKSTSHAAQSYVLTSMLPSKYRIPVIQPPSLIPDGENEAAYVGLYTMVYSLIALNGGKLADAKLQRYLHRMNASVNTPLDKTEIILAKMIKQGYIERKRENSGGDESIEWIAGPRGKVEIGNHGVEGLIKEVYAGSDTNSLEDCIATSLGIEKRLPSADEERAIVVDED